MAEVIKVIELADGTLTNMVDKNSKLSVNYKPVTTWYDGSTMDASKVDGDLYTKKGSKFYRKVIDKDGELFLEKDTMVQMRALTPREILYLKAGVYKGVKLNGYYTEGDIPTSIDYYISSTSAVDDGGSVIAVGGVKLENKRNTIYLSEYGAKEGSDIYPILEKIKNRIKYLGGGQLIIENKGYNYIYQFIENSTISSPTRIMIDFSGFDVVGLGYPTIKMQGLTKAYLDSIDDYASSGRDIFSVFSFCGNINSGSVRGVRFTGENISSNIFRYQSPRAIAVSIKGAKNIVVEDVEGVDLMGNTVNLVNSYINYDAPYSEYENCYISIVRSKNCLENAVNFMGGGSKCTADSIFSYGCANGLESACNDSIISNIVAIENRGSALALSGKNIKVSNVQANNSLGEAGKTNGYGVVITGGSNYQLNNIYAGGNKSYGFMLYPGVKQVYVDGLDLVDSDTSTAETMLYMTGLTGNRITGVTLNNVRVDIKRQAVSIGIVNYVEESIFKNINATPFIAPYSLLVQNSSNIDIHDCSLYRSISNVNSTNIRELNLGFRLKNREGNVGTPTSGTYNIGDKIINTTVSAGNIKDWVCIQGGTQGTLSSVSGDISSGSNILTVNNSSEIKERMYINIAGVSGVKRVIRVDGTSVIIDSVSDATVSSASVSYRGAVFVPCSQNGIRTSISSNPDFIGQIAVVANIAYIANTLTNWQPIGNNATTSVKGLVNQSSASADTATQASGATPTKAEFDALLAELRDLKTKMRAGSAPILAPNTP